MMFVDVIYDVTTDVLRTCGEDVLMHVIGDDVVDVIGEVINDVMIFEIDVMKIKLVLTGLGNAQAHLRCCRIISPLSPAPCWHCARRVTR